MKVGRYLLTVYLRYFLLILISLSAFFVGLDFIQHSDRLPDSANIQILYISHIFLHSLSYTLPIALVLGMVVSFILLIRSNELNAFLSLGYSKKNLFRPFFLTALFFSFLYVGLNATPFAYSKEQAEAILDRSYTSNSREDLFVKYANYYVYFGRVFPVLKRAEGVRVYEVEDSQVRRIIKGKIALFKNNTWDIQEATIIHKPDKLELGSTPLQIEKRPSISILKGFRPKILDSVYEAKSGLSIPDAIETWKLLGEQNINTEKVRTMLLSMIFFPFFAPLLGSIIFYHMPVLTRYANLALLTFLVIVLSLVAWGVLYTLTRLSISGLIIPEVGVLLPLALLAIVSTWYHRRLNY